MISANEARKMMNKDVAINECKKRTEKSILEAIKNGYDRVCLFYTNCYINDDGTISNDYKGKRIDCEYEIKSWLKDLGYRIEPTGCIGGVWQRTEHICW